MKKYFSARGPPQRRHKTGGELEKEKPRIHVCNGRKTLV